MSLLFILLVVAAAIAVVKDPAVRLAWKQSWKSLLQSRRLFFKGV